ncbi:MAG: AzlD domain-containing protein [Actinomycetota bacterium]
MSPIAQVIIVGVGTFLMRASLVTALAGVTIPARVERTLRLVAPAVLAAIVAQSLFLEDGDARAPSSWHVGGAVAALVVWKTKSVGIALTAGLAAHWLVLGAT